MPRDYLSSVYREDCVHFFFSPECVKEMHLVIQPVDLIWHYLTANQKYFTGGKNGAKNILACLAVNSF